MISIQKESRLWALLEPDCYSYIISTDDDCTVPEARNPCEASVIYRISSLQFAIHSAEQSAPYSQSAQICSRFEMIRSAYLMRV